LFNLFSEKLINLSIESVFCKNIGYVDLLCIEKMFISEIHFSNISESVVFTVGQNAQDNIEVIRKAYPNDIWFHAENESSCHVVARIRTGLTKKQLHTIIKYGCALCKNHTAKLKKKIHVECIYTEIRNVEIPEGAPIGTVNTSKCKFITV
jgi:predicted ribosome quality control (RQC) complex YloA/Tae2 family protein